MHYLNECSRDTLRPELSDPHRLVEVYWASLGLVSTRCTELDIIVTILKPVGSYRNVKQTNYLAEMVKVWIKKLAFFIREIIFVFTSVFKSSNSPL